MARKGKRTGPRRDKHRQPQSACSAGSDSHSRGGGPCRRPQQTPAARPPRGRAPRRADNGARGPAPSSRGRSSRGAPSTASASPHRVGPSGGSSAHRDRSFTGSLLLGPSLPDTPLRTSCPPPPGSGSAVRAASALLSAHAPWAHLPTCPRPHREAGLERQANTPSLPQ